MGEDSSSYLNYVNTSGFPLQIAIEHEVNQNQYEHGWYVVGREHHWMESQGGKDGYIDLVLSHMTYKYRAIIECKRQLDKSWVFLVSSDDKKKNSAILLWSQGLILGANDDATAFKAWDSVQIAPSSFTSSFCTMQGQSHNDKPMLERIGSEVVLMTESIAEEESAYVRSRIGAFPVIYLPMICTTAKLLVCKFQPSNISIQTGTLASENVEFVEVPFIQFQKSLPTNIMRGSTHVLPNIPEYIPDIDDSNKFQQRSIFVVQANAIVTFLKSFKLQEEDIYTSYHYPWKAIENLLRRQSGHNK